MSGECCVTYCGVEGEGTVPVCRNGHVVHESCLRGMFRGSAPAAPKCPSCRDEYLYLIKTCVLESMPSSATAGAETEAEAPMSMIEIPDAWDYLMRGYLLSSLAAAPQPQPQPQPASRSDHQWYFPIDWQPRAGRLARPVPESVVRSDPQWRPASE